MTMIYVFARNVSLLRVFPFYCLYTQLRAYSVLIILMLVPGIVKSLPDSVTVAEKNTTDLYYSKMDTVISVRLNFNNEHDRFILRGEDLTYDIRPSFVVSNRISVNYRFISLGAGFTLPFFPGNEGSDMRGSTRAFYIRMNLLTGKWLQELQYGAITGFYIYNTADFIADWEKGEDPYLQLPDLKVNMVLGSTSYKFNRNFSIKALTTQTEIQRKSCGSFIPSVSYSFYRIDNTADNRSPDISQRAETAYGVLTAGYFYTFVINRKIYIGAGIAPGIGISYTYLTRHYPDGTKKNGFFYPVYKLYERLGVGYNSRKFFAGADLAMNQWIRFKLGEAVELNATRTYFQVFFGYRFRAPEFLRRHTRQIEEQIPLLNPGLPKPDEDQPK